MSWVRWLCECEEFGTGKKSTADSAGGLCNDTPDASAAMRSCRDGYAKLQKSAASAAFHAGLTVPGAFRTISWNGHAASREEQCRKSVTLPSRQRIRRG